MTSRRTSRARCGGSRTSSASRFHRRSGRSWSRRRVRGDAPGRRQADGEKWRPYFQGGSSRFFHAGTNERWRGIFHDEDLALYEAKVEANFSLSARGGSPAVRLKSEKRDLAAAGARIWVERAPWPHDLVGREQRECVRWTSRGATISSSTPRAASAPWLGAGSASPVSDCRSKAPRQPSGVCCAGNPRRARHAHAGGRRSGRRREALFRWRSH